MAEMDEHGEFMFFDGEENQAGNAGYGMTTAIDVP